MESPQSPHLSSLWVFALSAIESYCPLPPVPISHLGTKLFSYSSIVVWPKGHLNWSICNAPPTLDTPLSIETPEPLLSAVGKSSNFKEELYLKMYEHDSGLR